MKNSLLLTIRNGFLPYSVFTQAGCSFLFLLPEHHTDTFCHYPHDGLTYLPNKCYAMLFFPFYHHIWVMQTGCCTYTIQRFYAFLFENSIYHSDLLYNFFKKLSLCDKYVERWPIKVFFRQSKDELAFDRYQVCSSTGIRSWFYKHSIYRLPFRDPHDKMEGIREGFDEPYGGNVGFPSDGRGGFSECEPGAPADAEEGGEADPPPAAG